MRVHTYVIVVDSGAAPNYDKPFTTLAVCKPRIRRKASIGELVLAFAGQKVNPYEPHTVVWAGVVMEKLSFAEYWNDPRFAGKKPDRAPTPDNFYRPIKGGGLLRVENPVHYLEQAEHDTNGRYVLVFNPSWRFGTSGPPLPTDFGLRMAHGRRGERVADLSEGKWSGLRAWLDDQQQAKPPRFSATRKCAPMNAPKRRSNARLETC